MNLKKLKFVKLFLLISIFSLIFCFSDSFSQKDDDNLNTSVLIYPDNEYSNTSIYNSYTFTLNISSNLLIDLNYEYDSLSYLSLGSKQFKMDINNFTNINPIKLDISVFFNRSNYNDNFPNIIKYNNYRLFYEYDTLTINVNKFGHGVLTCSNPSLEETGD